MQNLIEKLGLGESATSMVLWGGLSLVLLVFVLALAVWLIRTLRPNLNMSGGQGRGGRPQRLAITDAFSLDRDGRKLVIVRRDNIEHLLLIGGPNDVLVESNIVRGERSIRDRSGRGGQEVEQLQATEAALATETPRPEAALAATTPASSPPAAPSAPTPAFRTPPPAAPARPAPTANPAPRLDDEFERALAAMQAAQRQQNAQTSSAAMQPRPQPPLPSSPIPQPETRAAAPSSSAQPLPTQTISAQPVPAQPSPHPAPERAARQEPVSEMARRLNEVLQKPLSGTLRPPFNRPIPPVPSTPSMTPKPPSPPQPPPLPVEQAPPPPAPLPPLPDRIEPAAPLPVASPVPAPQAAAAVPETNGADSEMDLLEEEMARLLGRPAQPKKPGSP